MQLSLKINATFSLFTATKTCPTHDLSKCFSISMLQLQSAVNWTLFCFQNFSCTVFATLSLNLSCKYWNLVSSGLDPNGLPHHLIFSFVFQDFCQGGCIIRSIIINVLICHSIRQISVLLYRYRPIYLTLWNWSRCYNLPSKA